MSSKYLLTSLLSSLELNDYISIDLETTGLNPQKDRITEIAACCFSDGKFRDQYTTLINPGIPIPKNIVEITGISDDMLSDAPSIEGCESTESHSRDHLGLIPEIYFCGGRGLCSSSSGSRNDSPN